MNSFIQNDLLPDIVKTTNPKIGVIALSTDFTIEQDYRSICHQIPVDIFVNRIPVSYTHLTLPTKRIV